MMETAIDDVEMEDADIKASMMTDHASLLDDHSQNETSMLANHVEPSRTVTTILSVPPPVSSPMIVHTPVSSSGMLMSTIINNAVQNMTVSTPTPGTPNHNQISDDPETSIFCLLCDAELKGKWAYKKHITKHQWDAQRGQNNDDALTYHDDGTNDIPVDNDLNCPACTFVTRVPSELEKHLHCHLLGYQCLLCDFKTLHRARLAAHYPSHRREKARLECHICGNTLSTTSALKKHIARHSEGTICCSHCDYKTYDRFLLREHMATKHGEVSKKYKCEHCDQEFATFRQFFKHRQEEHKGFVYKRQFPARYCDKCDYQTTKVREFNVHKLSHLGLVDISHEGRYVCKVALCMESYNSAAKYEQHFTKVHDPDNGYGLSSERVHSCPVEGCNFSTVKESHLKLHMHVHRSDRAKKQTPNKPVKKSKQAGQCPLCMCKFSDKYKVRGHIETVHGNEKPFKCVLCDYKTAYKYNMKMHMKKLHNMHYDVKTGSCEPIIKDEGENLSQLNDDQPHTVTVSVTDAGPETITVTDAGGLADESSTVTLVTGEAHDHSAGPSLMANPDAYTNEEYDSAAEYDADWE